MQELQADLDASDVALGAAPPKGLGFDISDALSRVSDYAEQAKLGERYKPSLDAFALNLFELDGAAGVVKLAVLHGPQSPMREISWLVSPADERAQKTFGAPSQMGKMVGNDSAREISGDSPASLKFRESFTLHSMLAVEAGFALNAGNKSTTLRALDAKLRASDELSLSQCLRLVQTADQLSQHQATGSTLPHAKVALSELCLKLLRKEPMRALLRAHRALLASLARLMLRGVRGALAERQKEARSRGGARAERAARRPRGGARRDGGGARRQGGEGGEEVKEAGECRRRQARSGRGGGCRGCVFGRGDGS